MLDRISTAHQAGYLTDAEREQEIAAATARYERDCELARLANETGWHTWAGAIPSILYARRPKSSPPPVVRAATVAKLREAIEKAQAGLR